MGVAECGGNLTPEVGGNGWRHKSAKWLRGPGDPVATILGPLWPAGAADGEAWRRGEASFARAASALWKPRWPHS